MDKLDLTGLCDVVLTEHEGAEFRESKNGRFEIFLDSVSIISRCIDGDLRLDSIFGLDKRLIRI